MSTSVACFGTHWSPLEGRNTIAARCEHCQRPLGVTKTARDFDWWRPYTRVVISTADTGPDGTVLTTDVTNWCPACWTAVGRSAMEAAHPDVTFTELEVTP